MDDQKPRSHPSHDNPVLDQAAGHSGFGATSEILFEEVVTAGLLDKWIAAGIHEEDRGASLADTVWGTIRWDKRLGRPMTATLAEGFVIRHTYIQQEWVMVGPGLAKKYELVAPQPEPSKWDGPADADFYQITFLAQAKGRIWEANRISVEFAERVRWAEIRVRAKRGGYPYIDPLAIYFSATGKRIVLDPFEVTYKS